MLSDLRFGCRLQRPEPRDVLSAHVQKSGSDRREQPLVQARAVVVAAKIGDLEGELREGVCAVDDRLHPRRRASSQIFFTGKIWPVRFVMWQK